ncbi:LysR family transcriptional regulator [Rahnella sp. C60]|uniref:LysR family transcriptional regulator n=1 Tax=Rahnella perminowiae TaxID=2816244 RepID=UPI001C25B971|nr:LysR family transcriptional regulator [Rahnella perminowiae]MBU9808717.1 LysR family transcriptional regulator [Rahnella perminowiae]MBU9815373.1 LysR family transcriptional regulator [Rahnella perminowiae]MCR9003588.1 LysR family transcriptional regulator [Rahnella perminowiae]
MLNLQRLEIFVAVVSAGSFTRAATSLGLTKAVVSFNVKQLEIAHSRLPLPMRWPVITPGRDKIPFRVSSPAAIVADSASALLAFALAGAGVALLPDWLVQPEIDAQRLCHLLPDHRFPPQGIFALYPNTRHVPEKVRRFIDFLKKQMAESPAQSKI